MHRDDRSGTALDDALKAALKRRHQAGSSELAFGKNADDVARVERFAGFAKRLQNHLRAAAPVIGIAFIDRSTQPMSGLSKYSW